MTNWKEYKLGELGEVITGKTPSSKNPEQWGCDMPFVTPTDFDAYNKNITDSIRYLSKEGVKAFKKKVLPKNSVIVTCIGSQMGKVAINKKECVTNQQINSIVPSQEFNSDFIYYVLSSMQDYLRNLATGGSTMPIVNKTSFEEITISLPDLPTQTAIAEILSSLDDKIELNNKINQELENLAQTLFKQWFIDFEFPNENGEPYKSSGGEMIDSELGEIPKGWEVIKIEDLGEVICGKTPSKKISEYYGNDMPFIKIPDMHNNTYIVNAIDNLSVKGYKSQSNKTLPKNSIVVSSIATVGLVSITSEPSQTNQQINSIIPKEDWLTFYIYDLCKSLNDTFIQLASGGSATLNMNTSTFKNISVLLPNKAVIKEYHLLIVNLFEQIEMNIRENQELTNLRDTLLPKLISGELEVNGLNLDSLDLLDEKDFKKKADNNQGNQDNLNNQGSDK